MGRITNEVRKQIEQDILKGMKGTEIAAKYGVSGARVSIIKAALLYPEPKHTENPPPRPRKNPCRGCYWGKPAGHKITCFWQKCRKGGRV